MIYDNSIRLNILNEKLRIYGWLVKICKTKISIYLIRLTYLMIYNRFAIFDLVYESSNICWRPWYPDQ